mgnify:CR=1 FL=1
MEQEISAIIKPEDLLALQQSKELILIDASAGNLSKERYMQSHLDDALYVDMNTQLADIKPKVSDGGRHPLPTPAQFAETLAGLGISATSHVIIYDDKNGSNAAARFWWMLKAAGHKKVQVLDGGFDAAVKAGFPVNSTMVTPVKTDPYYFENWLLPLAHVYEVENSAKENNMLVIDVRSAERFNGEHEPIDPVAGHIPGAINIPFSTNLNTSGGFLSPQELKEKYTAAFGNIKPENIIVHCGSGVTACHTLLALTSAGIKIPKLYVGSWSEWSAEERPIVVKDTDQTK